MNFVVMKSREELHQELRQKILSLPGVTERQNAGIHEDAFFVGRSMFMHIQLRAGVMNLFVIGATGRTGLHALTDGEYLTYRSREGAAPSLGFTLARKAVAAFMLDAIEQQKHFHKIVGIAK